MEYFICSIYRAHTCDMVQDFSGISSFNFAFQAFYSKTTVLCWQKIKKQTNRK